MFLSMPCHEILALWEWCGWGRHRPRQVGKHPWQQCQGSWGKQLPETGWKQPSNQEFPGRGKCKCTHLSLGMEFTGGNGKKPGEGIRWGNPEDFMGSGGWLSSQPRTPTASLTLIHGKNPNTTFPAPSLLAHTTLSGVEHTLKLAEKPTQKITFCLKMYTWDKTRSCQLLTASQKILVVLHSICSQEQWMVCIKWWLEFIPLRSSEVKHKTINI